MGKEGRRGTNERRGESICEPVGKHKLQIIAGKNLKISASELICITAAASAPNKRWVSE